MRPEVLVFVMDGCHACGQIKPLIDQLAAHYAPCVDTRIVNCDAEEKFADAMGIEETPTVLGVVNKQPVVRLVGVMGNEVERLNAVYGRLIQDAQSCSVGPFRDV